MISKNIFVRITPMSIFAINRVDSRLGLTVDEANGRLGDRGRINNPSV